MKLKSQKLLVQGKIISSIRKAIRWKIHHCERFTFAFALRRKNIINLKSLYMMHKKRLTNVRILYEKKTFLISLFFI